MKKSFIRNGLLLLSALTMMACTNGGSSSSSSPASSETPSSQTPSSTPSSQTPSSTPSSQTPSSTPSSSTPSSSPASSAVAGFDPSDYEEAGKVFFYFTMSDETVEIPEYCGIYLTGAFNSWATAIEEVAVMTLVEGETTIYGCSFTVDGTALTEADYGYQMTLGYTADSGSPSTGVNWSYKSDECQAGSGESGTENLSFAMNESKLSANLGTHTWGTVPSPVTVVEDIDIQLSFAAAVPERIDLYMPGNFKNNWTTGPEYLADNKMTPDADRKVFTMHVDQINLGTFEAKIIAEYSDITALSWSTTVLDDGQSGNFILGILKKYGGGVYDLNTQFTSSNTAFTLDEDGLVAVDWDTVLPEKSAEMVDFTFEVTFAQKTNAETITAKGTFDSWGDGAVLTSSEDGLTWTSASLSLSAGSAVSFGFPLDAAWNVAIKGMKADGSGLDNFSVTLLETDCTIKVAVDAENCTLLDQYIAAADPTQWVSVEGVASVVAVEATPAA